MLQVAQVVRHVLVVVIHVAEVVHHVIAYVVHIAELVHQVAVVALSQDSCPSAKGSYPSVLKGVRLMAIAFVRKLWKRRNMDLPTAALALNALSHETRLAAFRALIQAGEVGLPVGELRQALEVPGATLTAHLNVLRQAGLVNDAREGRVIRLRADYARMDALLAYLTENCCAGATACGPATTSAQRKQAICP